MKSNAVRPSRDEDGEEEDEDGTGVLGKVRERKAKTEMNDCNFLCCHLFWFWWKAVIELRLAMNKQMIHTSWQVGVGQVDWRLRDLIQPLLTGTELAENTETRLLLIYSDFFQ